MAGPRRNKVGEGRGVEGREVEGRNACMAVGLFFFIPFLNCTLHQWFLLGLLKTAGIWEKEYHHLSQHGNLNLIPEKGRSPQRHVWFNSFSSGPGSSYSCSGLNSDAFDFTCYFTFSFVSNIWSEDLKTSVPDLFCDSITSSITEGCGVMFFALSFCFLI